MNRLFDRLKGLVRAEICGAFPEAVLNLCAARGLVLWDMDCADEYRVRVSLHERELKELEAAAEKCMCQVRTLSLRGGSRDRKLIKGRLWLIAFALLCAGLLFLSSLFIWEIEIRGCDSLSRGRVLRALEDCGVSEGSFWPSLSSDLVRSRMLIALPELSWMTVNVSGSRAVVLLMERTEKPEIYIESEASDIVAKSDGFVTDMSVLNGKPLVQPGQAVMEGEILVTGVMDSLSGPPRLIKARASVEAETWHELTAVCPLESGEKTELKKRKLRFALKIGRNRINFYFSSGKDIDECDKLVEEYKLGVKGLFALPISLVKEELCYWQGEAPAKAEQEAMKERLYKSLESSVDGEILSHGYSVSVSEGLLYVTLRAHCLENIACEGDISGA